MKMYKRIMILFSLLLIAALGAGCGNGTAGMGEVAPEKPGLDGPANGNDKTKLSLEASLPSLPELEAMSQNNKSASVLNEHSVSADLFYTKSPNAQGDGTDMNLIAGPGEISYAIYSVPIMFNETPDGFDFKASMSEGDEGYMAIADYSTGRWHFFAPQTDFDYMELLDGMKYVSPGSNVFFAILAYDDAQCNVDTLIFETDVDE